jgi:hypothetical protein
VAELNPEKLLRDWEKRFEGLVELEERLRSEVGGRLVAPLDAVFDLLEESGTMLRRQAEAVEAAGRALEETARLMARQADLFEHTVGTLRRPAELAKAAAGVERKGAARKRPARKR